MTKRVLAAALLLSGCMTWDTRTDPAYDGPRVYSGTLLDASQMGNHFMSLNLPWVLIFGFDLPLSFVADTVLLPWTIPEEMKRREERRNDLQLGEQRPSPIRVEAGTAPVSAARRLFQACLGRLQHYDPLLTDCFAEDARIFYDEGQPRMLSGSEFKPHVRAALADLQGRSEFVAWRRPRYEPEGERVRIEVERESSTRGDLGKLELVVGPSADGGWRIQEMRGATWR